MYNVQDDEDESISNSSSSTSSMVFRKYSSDSISDSDSNIAYENDSDSSASLASNEDSDSFEEMLVAFALMTNESLDTIQILMNELFTFSTLRQSEIDSCRVPNLPRMKRTFESMSDHECYDWTRFTKSQLIELKAYFLQILKLK